MAVNRVQKLNQLQQAVLGDLGQAYQEKVGRTGLKEWGVIARKLVMIRLGVQTFDGCVKLLREYRTTHEAKNELIRHSTEIEHKLEREHNDNIIAALNIAIGDILMVKTIGTTEQEALYTVYVQYATLDHERVIATLKALAPDYDNIEASHFMDKSGMSSATFSVKDRAIYDEIELLYAKGVITYAQLSMGRARYLEDGSC